jgi:hypothetical protein
MMLRQDLRDPQDDQTLRMAPEDLVAPLARAFEAAGASEGAEPWRFYLLEPEVAAAVAWLAARGLEKTVGAEGARAAYEQWRAVPGWIAVTCRRSESPQQTETYREAALTAVQRATLSLWSDDIPSNWVQDLASDEPELYLAIGADPLAEDVLGVVLFGHPDRREMP